MNNFNHWQLLNKWDFFIAVQFWFLINIFKFNFFCSSLVKNTPILSSINGLSGIRKTLLFKKMRLLNLNDKNYVLKIFVRYPTNTLFWCTKAMFQLTKQKMCCKFWAVIIQQTDFYPQKSRQYYRLMFGLKVNLFGKRESAYRLIDFLKMCG